jgi:hypothetical protein
MSKRETLSDGIDKTSKNQKSRCKKPAEFRETERIYSWTKEWKSEWKQAGVALPVIFFQ